MGRVHLGGLMDLPVHDAATGTGARDLELAALLLKSTTPAQVASVLLDRMPPAPDGRRATLVWSTRWPNRVCRTTPRQVFPAPWQWTG